MWCQQPNLDLLQLGYWDAKRPDPTSDKTHYVNEINGLRDVRLEPATVAPGDGHVKRRGQWQASKPVRSSYVQKLEYVRPAAIFLLVLLLARVLSYVVDGPVDAIGVFIAVPATVFAMMAAGHLLLARAARPAHTRSDARDG